VVYWKYLFRHIAFILVACLVAPKAFADQEDLNQMIKNALESVSLAKYESEEDDELDDVEEERVKKNAVRKIKKHFNKYGDPDSKAEHFIESVDYEDDFYIHATKCKVCNPFVNSLISGTGIKRIPFIKPNICPSGVATHCQTNFGACGMAVPIPIGSSCYCPSYAGPIWGAGACYR